jgi:hypothetical protein
MQTCLEEAEGEVLRPGAAGAGSRPLPPVVRGLADRRLLAAADGFGELDEQLLPPTPGVRLKGGEGGEGGLLASGEEGHDPSVGRTSRVPSFT